MKGDCRGRRGTLIGSEQAACAIRHSRACKKLRVAGRVYKGVPPPYNLRAPPYGMVSDKILQIGENPLCIVEVRCPCPADCVPCRTWSKRRLSLARSIASPILSHPTSSSPLHLYVLASCPGDLLRDALSRSDFGPADGIVIHFAVRSWDSWLR